MTKTALAVDGLENLVEGFGNEFLVRRLRYCYQIKIYQTNLMLL